jgi:hypothetical protein
MSEYKSSFTNYDTKNKYTDSDTYSKTNYTSVSRETISNKTDFYYYKNLSIGEIYKIIRNNEYKKNHKLHQNIKSNLSSIFYDYFCYFIKKKLGNLPNVNDYKSLLLKELYNISFWDAKKKDKEFSKFANWLERYKNTSQNFVNKISFVYLIVELVLFVDDRIFIDGLLREKSENTQHIIKNLQRVGLDLRNCNSEFIFYKTSKRLARFLYENVDKIIPKNINHQNKNDHQILENIFTHKQDMIELCKLTISSSIPVKQMLELNVKLHEFKQIFEDETCSLIEYKTKLQTQHKNNIYKVLSYINSDHTEIDSVSKSHSDSESYRHKTDTISVTSRSNKDSSYYLKDFFAKASSPCFQLQEIKNIELPQEYHIKKLDEESEEIKYINLPIKKK